MWVFALVAAILLVQAALWLVIVRWMTAKMDTVKRRMSMSGGERVIIGPASAVYRGADMRFGNVKGNGVLCLYEHHLLFEKLTGQLIRIDRSEIAGASVESWFKGKPSLGTRGKHLVVRTTNGNRIGFLLRDAETWAENMRPGTDRTHC